MFDLGTLPRPRKAYERCIYYYDTDTDRHWEASSSSSSLIAGVRVCWCLAFFTLWCICYDWIVMMQINRGLIVPFLKLVSTFDSTMQYVIDKYRARAHEERLQNKPNISVRVSKTFTIPNKLWDIILKQNRLQLPMNTSYKNKKSSRPPCLEAYIFQLSVLVVHRDRVSYNQRLLLRKCVCKPISLLQPASPTSTPAFTLGITCPEPMTWICFEVAQL